MIDNDDGRDPLRVAFDEHQRAPRDIVPRSSVEQRLDGLRELAGRVQTVTHYEATLDGVTKYTEHVTITAPFTTERAQS